MDCYIWSDRLTGNALLIPVSDAAETYVKNELSGISEATNTSLMPDRQAYVLPQTGGNNARLTTLLAPCSHDKIDHDTCVDDPGCDEKIRLLPQAPALGS